MLLAAHKGRLAALGGGLSARVGRIASMPGGGTGGIECEAFSMSRLRGHMGEDALGHGRAADVAQADEADADRHDYGVSSTLPRF